MERNVQITECIVVAATKGSSAKDALRAVWTTAVSTFACLLQARGANGEACALNHENRAQTERHVVQTRNVPSSWSGESEIAAPQRVLGVCSDGPLAGDGIVKCHLCEDDMRLEGLERSDVSEVVLKRHVSVMTRVAITIRDITDACTRFGSDCDVVASCPETLRTGIAREIGD